MQDPTSAALADAWAKFDTPLRMRKGFNEGAYTALTSALQACAEAWASRDAVPRLGANILVDVFSATEGNIALYEDDVAQRVTEAAFELQFLAGQCVALDV